MARPRRAGVFRVAAYPTYRVSGYSNHCVLRCHWARQVREAACKTSYPAIRLAAYPATRGSGLTLVSDTLLFALLPYPAGAEGDKPAHTAQPPPITQTGQFRPP